MDVEGRTPNRRTRHVWLMFVVWAVVFGGCYPYGVEVTQDPIDGPVRHFEVDLGKLYRRLSAREARGRHTIEFVVYVRGESTSVVAAGTPVQIKVGERLHTLATAVDVGPISRVFIETKYTTWAVRLEPSPAEFAALGAERISAIRLDVGGRTHTIEPSRWEAARIQRGLLELSRVD